MTLKKDEKIKSKSNEELESKRVKKILSLLDKNYGKHIPCFLNYKKDYELLFATILAAQCTDARVNEVTKELFRKYKKLEEYSNAKLKDIEKIIMPCGFYHAKAKSIKETAAMLISDYNSKVPSQIEELVKLKGVGRKTANVIRTHIYNIPSVVVDTHVLRTSMLLGLAKSKDPEKVEKELEARLPKSHWSNINPQLMTLGRNICKARKRECEACFLNDVCRSYKERNSSKSMESKEKQKVIKNNK